MTTFSHRLRVYWEDTDAGGVVFYANYLKFFERARTEWLRSLGVSQHALLQDLGAMFVVSNTAVTYRAPARLDDELDVSVRVQRLGSASITVAQRATRHDNNGTTLVAEGKVKVGCVDAGTFRPRRIPNVITEKLA